MDMRRLPLALIATAFVAGAVCATATAADPLGKITLYTAGLQPNNKSSIQDLALGADGNLWFTDLGPKRSIGRITADGQITELRTGLNPGARPTDITAGPDGNLWFTDHGTTPAIGRITPAGAITEFALPPPGPKATDAPDPEGITDGPDGNLWFADNSDSSGVAIGRVTPAGDITYYKVADNDGDDVIRDLVAGPDGNVWFTDGTPELGSIAPDGHITRFTHLGSVTVGTSLGQSEGLAAGPGGDLWFTYGPRDDNLTKVSRITTAGELSGVALTGLQPEGQSNLNDIATGPDGNLWLTDDGALDGTIDRMTPDGHVTLFPAGPALEMPSPTAITPGPGGDMWFASRGPFPAIGRIGTGAGSVPRQAPVTVVTCTSSGRHSEVCRTRLTRSPPARSSTTATLTPVFGHTPDAVGSARTIDGKLVITITSFHDGFGCEEILHLRTGHRTTRKILQMGFNC
jgi:streptogramin lyase